jgi:hypothetical protein
MSARNKYTPQQIRRARQVELAPLLKQMGYRLHELENGNTEVHGLPQSVIIKEHYWHSPDIGTGGNAIDLLTQILGISFSNAMKKLEPFM